MQIEIFSGFSKEINSTKRPSGSGRTLNVNLKDNCSVLEPVFLIAGYNLADNYIRWGSRYYFVDDIVIVGNELAEYHCSTDVLATYKDIIGASSQYVLRAQSAYNGALNDAIYPTQANSLTSFTNMDRLTSTDSLTLNQGSCFVIGIQNGSGSQNGGITYYAMSEVSMQNLLNYMFTTADFLNASDVSVELQKELVNPFQYISSIIWLPFDLPSSPIATPKSLTFGYWTPSQGNIYGYQLSKRTVTFSGSVSLPRHPDAAADSRYLNGAPYSRHMLYANSFGSIPIDASYFVDSATMAVLVYVDLYTGMGKITLNNGSGNKIYQADAQVGANAQISQVTQSAIGSALNVVGGAVGLAYGNVVGFAQGIVSGLENLMPQVSTTGSVGSSVDWEQVPMQILSTFYRQADKSPARLGRPLCRELTINTLSGFIQVQNADVAGVGTTREKQEVIGYMEGGFYYE